MMEERKMEKRMKRTSKKERENRIAKQRKMSNIRTNREWEERKGQND